MLDKPTTLALAVALTEQDPLPKDVEKQLDALYVKANEIEKALFADLYEGLFLQLDEQ